MNKPISTLILLIFIILFSSCTKKNQDENNIISNQKVNILKTQKVLDSEKKQELINITQKKIATIFDENFYKLSESSLATMDCKKFFYVENLESLLDYELPIYEKYIKKCEELQLPAKISFYTKEIEKNPKKEFKLWSNYKDEYKIYKNSYVDTTYELYLSGFSDSSGWLIPFTKEEFELNKLKFLSYNDFVTSKNWEIEKQRLEFTKKQEEYKVFLDNLDK